LRVVSLMMAAVRAAEHPALGCWYRARCQRSSLRFQPNFIRIEAGILFDKRRYFGFMWRHGPQPMMTRDRIAKAEKKLGSLQIGMPHGITICSYEEPTLDRLPRPSAPHLYPSVFATFRVQHRIDG
jgi:hypothetical protein